MRGIIIIAVSCLVMPSVALAGASVKFAPYEGPKAIQHGEGGSRITKNGIDYWNTGTPPRRYQIIGVITDKRYEQWGDGTALGSKKVAKTALKFGGDAVILLSGRETGGGSYGVPIAGGGFAALGLSRETTQLLVVKYLDE